MFRNTLNSCWSGDLEIFHDKNMEDNIYSLYINYLNYVQDESIK